MLRYRNVCNYIYRDARLQLVSVSLHDKCCQTFSRDSIRANEYKKSIWSVLDNIYQCDKLTAAKRLAVLSNEASKQAGKSSSEKEVEEEKLRDDRSITLKYESFSMLS